jgi:hypothetical protein
MPPRNAVSQLPDSLKSELDRRIIESNFSGYRDLSDWLDREGYYICKSSLHKYGRDFESRLAALKLSHDFAIAYKESLPDDAGARAEVLTELAQDSLFNLLIQLHDLSCISKLISTTTRAISDVNRSGVTVKKYSADIKAKQEAKFREMESIAEKGGLDLEFLQRVKTEVLRIC